MYIEICNGTFKNIVRFIEMDLGVNMELRAVLRESVPEVFSSTRGQIIRLSK